MRLFGSFLVVGGLALMIWGLLYDASIPSAGGLAVDRIMNLSLITTQLLIFMAGGFATLSGVVLVAAGAAQSSILEALGKAKSPPQWE